MATFNTDVIITVFHSVVDRAIGQESKFAVTEHPGSGKKIEGWKWDQRTWPDENEFRAVALSPSIWDPTSSGIDEDYLQSGFGDNKDLLLLDIEKISLSGVDVWAPKLNHGYFYIRDEEWYLYSDSYLTEYFTVTGVVDSQQVLRLSRQYKPSIPITVRNFEFNRTLARHQVNIDFRKKIEFTVNSEDPEFTIDTTSNPPLLVLNGEHNQEVGVDITLSVSGTADIPDNDVTNLDFLGISDGIEGQEFALTFSPVDPSQSVAIWTWLDPRFPTLWNVIDPLTEFNVTGLDVKMDKDRGTIAFGDYDPATMIGGGLVPTEGSHIGAYYTSAVAAFYEPKDTRDDILASSAIADVNPVTSTASRGFVQITTESVDPTSITLTSTLPKVNPFIIQLGNNIGEMIAEVKNESGDLLEGQEVTFEIVEPTVGTFGATAFSAIGITESNGQAKTLYNSPPTIQELGQASSTASYSGGNTIIDVAGVVEPSTLSGIFLFKVHTEDDVLGIAEADEATYYTDYLTEENIVSGIQASQSFEEDFRTINSLRKPPTYSTSELNVGKKTMMLTTRSNVMNPHTGTVDPTTLTPLFPIALENIGTSSDPILRMTYSGLSLPIPGTGDTKAYFAVGDALTHVRAFVTNKRTNRKIFSNTIELEVRIPDTANGTYLCDVLSDIPVGLLTKAKDISLIPGANINATSGIDEFYTSYMDERLRAGVGFETYLDWFNRTRQGDTIGLTLAAATLSDPLLSGLDQVIPIDCPSEIPLGFRLKSTGITVASILDQVTFLDPNDHLPSGTFGG